jgi:hypothetical protein
MLPVGARYDSGARARRRCDDHRRMCLILSLRERLFTLAVAPPAVLISIAPARAELITDSNIQC